MAKSDAPFPEGQIVVDPKRPAVGEGQLVAGVVWQTTKANTKIWWETDTTAKTYSHGVAGARYRLPRRGEANNPRSFKQPPDRSKKR